MKWKWLAFVLSAMLSGCASDRAEKERPEAPPNPFSEAAIPEALRGGAQPIGPGGGIPDELRNDAGVVLDPDEIVWTDPDAEDGGAVTQELKDLLSAAPTEGPWRKSYTNAFREARLTGKPVLMWFTDSRNSPNCRALNEDLFSKREFESWAEETFVRLQFDQNVQGSKTDNDSSTKAAFIKDMKKRYKVLGQPTLLVLTPAGEVIGRYRGYQRGESEYKWGQLRQGAKLAGEAHEKWIARMEKKGYRFWSDPRGRKLFAKLISYQDGDLILVEPDGTRARTKERHLSPDDQDWIAEQKRRRGMQ